jgi:polyhydroxyalkanoate synthesis regulator phasin
MKTPMVPNAQLTAEHASHGKRLVFGCDKCRNSLGEVPALPRDLEEAIEMLEQFTCDLQNAHAEIQVLEAEVSDLQADLYVADGRIEDLERELDDINRVDDNDNDVDDPTDIKDDERSIEDYGYDPAEE